MGIGPQPLVPMSFLTDTADILWQIGERRPEELPKALYESHIAGLENKPARVYVLWATATNPKAVSKSSIPESGSANKYSKAATSLSKDLWRRAKEYHPAVLAEDQSKNPKWLNAMQLLIDENGVEKIESVLDHVFGNPEIGLIPDIFWKDKISSAEGLSRNFKKLMDDMVRKQRRRQEATKKQTSGPPRELSGPPRGPRNTPPGLRD